ncbi:atpG [Symbiodinium necroappetens]|uniref:F-ATPase gamma subunit n=1 Tax=Symbiodinium necroappetens TaxID=1628268 RepID=A0A812RHF8_9DINO|nr:atpG [Symbiodinium necroappetens]
MANARDIKKRIKAVGNIKRITKTMQMIATSKFARAQSKATAAKPFTEGVYELVRELAAKAGNVSHPLIEGPAGGPKGEHLVLVLTSDRGLCGPYNGSIIRMSLKHIRELGDEARVEVSGRKGASTLKFNKIPIADQHTIFGDNPRYEDVEKLAQKYMDMFMRGEVASVSVAYMRFISTSRQSAEIRPLLPLKPPAVEGDVNEGSGTKVDYEFTPSAEELLAEILPLTVKTTLLQCFNDAIVSEHVARMVAMKAATDNAGKMGKSLTRKYNRARQAQITTELTEIISGAAALE